MESTMDLKRVITRVGAVAALTLFTLPASAQDHEDECTQDADCADGFTCETVDYGYCEACPAPPPGEEEEPGRPACGECFEESVNVCSPPPPEPCTDDSDCGGEEVCVSYTFETCQSAPIAPCETGSDCPDPEPVECDVESEAYCVPRYFAPCDADADCGGGFTCETIEICECSGSGSTVEPGTDGEEQPVDEPDCTCSDSGEGYCELIEKECTTDADCAGGHTCQTLGYEYDDEPMGGVVCAPDEECPTEPIPDEEPTPVSRCAPPGYGSYYGSAEDAAYGEVLAESTGRASSDVKSAERQEFFPEDADGEAGEKASAAGCSTADATPQASLFLLLLAGFLLRRDRRRRS